jgi:PAS domain S-box-containing protein
VAVSGLDDHEPDALARLTLLARVGEILGSGLRRQDTLHHVAELLSPGLATWCVFDVADMEGVLTHRVSVPADAPLAPDAPHGPAIVMRTGEPELVRDAERFGLRSMVCVPLIASGHALGALSLLSADQRYGAFEVELASEIARRIAAAIEVQRSEERYRMLFEASPMPMWVYDADTLSFLAVNDAAVRHYGYPRDEFLAMRITDIRPPEDVPSLLADVKARGGPGSPNAKVWRHIRKDRSIISVEITAGRITFEGRKAALVLAHDVTDRLRLEQRLAEAEKMEAIGRLAGGVAHDFNNLLTVIAGYGEIARRRIGAGPGAGELEEITRAAERAGDLTRQLLAFARRQVLAPVLLDVNDVAAGLVPMLSRLIGETVEIAMLSGPDLPPVLADRAQLEQVIINLAINARDAMPAGGTLAIETSASDDHVRLAVSDTGSGIDPDELERIFEPFYTTKEVGLGTGLGLATVHGIVTQSGGWVDVSSDRGLGSTFTVWLPAAEDAQSAPEAVEQDERPRLGGDETLLLCEDEDGVRALVELVLTGAGYTVFAAGRPEDALRIALREGDAIDALVTDIVMPGMSGLELAQRLAPLRTLFISGYSNEAFERHGGLPPGSQFLEKPFDHGTLLAEIRDLLDSPRPIESRS